MPKGATPRVSPTGNVSKPNEVNPGSNGIAPRERWQIQKDIDSVKEQIERAKDDRKTWTDQYGAKHPEDKPRPEAQKRIAALNAERQNLEAELDALVPLKTAL